MPSTTSAKFLSERLQEAYSGLGRRDIRTIESLYTIDVYFEDPLSGVQGREALLTHFATTFKNLHSRGIKFHQSVSNGSEIFLAWTMFVNDTGKSGESFVPIEGASYYKTRNGKIYYQRDYFDQTSLLRQRSSLLDRILTRLGAK